MPSIDDFVKVERNSGRYRLQSWEWKPPEEAGGLHHIFVDVRTQDGDRLVGTPIFMGWDGGQVPGVIEAKPGEPWGGNFPINGPLGAYSVWAGSEGDSDVVSGMGMGTPDEPWRAAHTWFGLVFEYVPEPLPEPEPEPLPEPEPEPPPEPEPDPPPGDLKDSAWWADQFQQVCEKLDRIQALLSELVGE